jgi:ankyrin repeat protein
MTDDIQKKLDAMLSDAAYVGRTDDVLSLLEKGADVNSTNDSRRTPLMRAAYHGHLETVQILLEAGADRTPRDDSKDTAEDDARKNGHKNVETLLQEYVHVAKTSDEIIFQSKISNRTLEEVFNFVRRERISLIRKTPHGAVEAMTCVNFSAIEDQSDDSQLRKAFNEHVKRGGTVDEAVIFPNKLPKNKLKRGG